MGKSFENSMEELENVVKKLEEGKLTLNDSIEESERGMVIVRACREELTKAKQKVTRVLQNGEEVPFGENLDEQ